MRTDKESDMDMSSEDEQSAGQRFWHFFRNSSLFRDIMLCIGITAACAIFGFDTFVSDRVIIPIRVIVLLLMALNWCVCSYRSGGRRRGGFALFAGIYWIVPTLVMFFTGASGSESRIVAAAGEIARILVFYPFSFIAAKAEIPEWVFSASMLGMITAMYIIGENRNAHRFDDTE